MVVRHQISSTAKGDEISTFLVKSKLTLQNLILPKNYSSQAFWDSTIRECVDGLLILSNSNKHTNKLAKKNYIVFYTKSYFFSLTTSINRGIIRGKRRANQLQNRPNIKQIIKKIKDKKMKKQVTNSLILILVTITLWSGAFISSAKLIDFLFWLHDFSKSSHSSFSKICTLYWNWIFSQIASGNILAFQGYFLYYNYFSCQLPIINWFKNKFTTVHW